MARSWAESWRGSIVHSEAIGEFTFYSANLPLRFAGDEGWQLSSRTFHGHRGDEASRGETRGPLGGENTTRTSTKIRRRNRHFLREPPTSGIGGRGTNACITLRAALSRKRCPRNERPGRGYIVRGGNIEGRAGYINLTSLVARTLHVDTRISGPRYLLAA